jgi:hypothetical protein
MLRSVLLCAAALLALSLMPSASRAADTLDADRLAVEVKAEFLHAWHAYKTYAWGHDGLRPLSRTFYDWHEEPLYLGAIEGMGTLYLMGETAEADSVREFLAQNLSFDKDFFVKNFEITIRVLGALVSGYQMTEDARLLELARDLGDRLLPAFQKSPTGMPYMYVNLRTGEVKGTKSNPGEIGTMLVEWGALSQLTGDPKYYNYAKYALLQVYGRRSPLDLVGTWLDVETGEWLDPDSHLSACIDSYYEYMVKAAILFDDKDCWEMWRTSSAAIFRYLADTTATGLWYGHADMNTGKRTKQWFGALDAFFPAVLALAGELKGAAELQRSCMLMWNRHGVEPEQFDYDRMHAARNRYFLNPEIMESTYYLYVYTGDDHYRWMGKALFDSLRTYCRVENGYAELQDVITKEKFDRMESYFLAETLKYLYLLFAPPEVLDFRTHVFNTEAHPIRRTW